MSNQKNTPWVPLNWNRELVTRRPVYISGLSSVIRLSLGRRSVNLLPVAQRTNAFNRYRVQDITPRFKTFFSLMLRYGLGRRVITSEIGNWSVFLLLGWRFVFGIIMK